MAQRKRRRRYFTEKRREVYLEDLRRTGNHASAARAAGITDGGARRYRRRTPEFETACAAAEFESQRRLAGAQGPLDGTNEAAFESIRRGADGRLKIQAQGRRRWSRRKEELFFAVLRECGNVAASARAAGVSKEAVWKRRREWPGFARRMEETLDEAEIGLEYRVACLGTNWTENAEERERTEVGTVTSHCPQFEEQAGTVTSNCPQFDPDLALRFLKWRAEKKRGARAQIAALPPAEEVRRRIVRKVLAIKKHKAREARRAAEDGE